MEPRTGPWRRIGVRVLAALVLGTALAAGCSGDTDATPTFPPPDGGASPAEEVRGALTAARQRWEEAAVATYRYVFADDCAECDPSDRVPREVVVWGGERFDPGNRSPSVEAIFTEIEQALDAGRSVAATFDPELGHPTDVAIDLESRPVDGGTHWVVQGLEPGLPGDAISVNVVADAQRLWLDSRPDAYEYTLTVFCACPLEGSVRARVVGNAVVTHQALYDDSTSAAITPIAVDDMFADLADLMASVDGVVEGGIRFAGSARFHPELGYPAWVGLDLTVLDADSDLAQLPGRLVATITELHPVDPEEQESAGDQLTALDEAKARWQASGVTDYRYELTFHTLQTAEFTGPFTVTVNDGSVVSVTRDERAVPDGQISAYTVDELFDMIDRHLRDRVEVSVTYHQVFGHPVLVALDLDAIAVDGGLMLSVSHLTVTELRGG